MAFAPFIQALGQGFSDVFGGLNKAEESYQDTNRRNIETWLRIQEAEMARRQKMFEMAQEVAKQRAIQEAYSPENLGKLFPQPTTKTTEQPVPYNPDRAERAGAAAFKEPEGKVTTGRTVQGFGGTQPPLGFQPTAPEGDRSGETAATGSVTSQGPLAFPGMPPMTGNPQANAILAGLYEKMYGGPSKVERDTLERQMRRELAEVDSGDPAAPEKIQGIMFKYAHPDQALTALNNPVLVDRQNFRAGLPSYAAKLATMKQNPAEAPYINMYESAMASQRASVMARTEEDILKMKQAALTEADRDETRRMKIQEMKEAREDRAAERANALKIALSKNTFEAMVHVRDGYNLEAREALKRRSELMAEYSKRLAKRTDPKDPEMIRLNDEIKDATADLEDIRARVRQSGDEMTKMLQSEGRIPSAPSGGLPPGVRVRRRGM